MMTWQTIGRISKGALHGHTVWRTNDDGTGHVGYACTRDDDGGVSRVPDRSDGRAMKDATTAARRRKYTVG